MHTAIYYTVITAILVLTLFLFTARHLRARSFRLKIADTHGFSQGIMTGYAYPLFIVTTALLVIQFFSFIIFNPKTELEYCLRTSLYAITFCTFVISMKKTPKLLAYWFGKTALWDDFKLKGKIPYTDITCAMLAKENDPLPANPQRLCTFSFYTDKRVIRGIPKKFTCKLTALELTHISEQIPLYHTSDAKKFFKENLKPNALLNAVPFVKAFAVLSVMMLLFSYGVFFTPRYTPDEYDKSIEVNTVTKVTDVISKDNTIAVYYENINALSVYNTDGTHRFSLVFDVPMLAAQDIRLTDEKIYHRYANSVNVYSAFDGALVDSSDISKYSDTFLINKTTDYSTNGIDVYKTTPSGEREYLLDRGAYLYPFLPVYSWKLLVISIAALFVIKYIFSDRTPPIISEKAKLKKAKKSKKLDKNDNAKPSKIPDGNADSEAPITDIKATS